MLSHASGRGKTSGVELRRMTAGVAVLFHIRNGKVTRLVPYFDRDRVLADLSVAAEADGP
jgi:ketosteroid isomerase-like protein